MTPISGFTGQRIGALQSVALDSLVSVTITPPANADFLWLEIGQHDARITFDGTEPTATVGFTLHKDTPHPIDIGQDTVLKLIALADSPVCQWQAWKKKRDNDV